MYRTSRHGPCWRLAVLAGVLAATLLAGAAPNVTLAQEGGAPEDHDSSTCEPTAAQRAAADLLVADTAAALGPYPTPESARAAGYRPFMDHGPGQGREGNGTWHYVNRDYARDDVTLDPGRIEAIIYGRTPDGGIEAIGSMYIAPRGAQPPQPGGCLTTWHTHTVGGVTTAPMLHVWLVDLPGGPFAHQGSAHYACRVLGRTGVAPGFIISPPECEPRSLAHLRAAIATEVAAYLDLTPAELATRIASGESLVDLAEAAGIPASELRTVLVATIEGRLGRAVDAGQMTERQAERLLARLEHHVDRLIDHQGPGSGPGPGPGPVPDLP